MSSRGVDHDPPGSPLVDRSDVLRALVPAERRRLVSDLLDRPGPVELEELSTRLAADHDDDFDEPVASAVSSAAMRLRQVHLPVLSSAGIVCWNECESTVSAVSFPALHDPLVGRVLAERSGAWDDIVEALADSRRRAVLAHLESDPAPTSPSELARELAVGVPEEATDPDEIEVSLRHCHLPKLDAAGLIEYDDDSVAASDHPAIDGLWFDSTRVDPCSGPVPPRSPEEFDEG